MPGIIGFNGTPNNSFQPADAWAAWMCEDSGGGAGSGFYTPLVDEVISSITFGGQAGSPADNLYVVIMEVLSNGGAGDADRALFADYNVPFSDSALQDWTLDLSASPLTLPANREFAIYGYLGSVANGATLQYLDDGSTSSIEINGGSKEPYAPPFTTNSTTANALRLFAVVDSIGATPTPTPTPTPTTTPTLTVNVTTGDADSPTPYVGSFNYSVFLASDNSFIVSGSATSDSSGVALIQSSLMTGGGDYMVIVTGIATGNPIRGNSYTASLV